jgi:hypothetical protein
VIKRVFGFVKVRYRGLAKNTQRLWVTCGLTSWSGAGCCAPDTGNVPGAYQPGIKYREFRCPLHDWCEVSCPMSLRSTGESTLSAEPHRVQACSEVP